MNKKILLLFSICLLLTGCGNKEDSYEKIKKEVEKETKENDPMNNYKNWTSCSNTKHNDSKTELYDKLDEHFDIYYDNLDDNKYFLISKYDLIFSSKEFVNEYIKSQVKEKECKYDDEPYEDIDTRTWEYSFSCNRIINENVRKKIYELQDSDYYCNSYNTGTIK